jgi:hypothetical protein
MEPKRIELKRNHKMKTKEMEKNLEYKLEIPTGTKRVSLGAMSTSTFSPGW